MKKYITILYHGLLAATVVAAGSSVSCLAAQSADLAADEKAESQQEPERQEVREREERERRDDERAAAGERESQARRERAEVEEREVRERREVEMRERNARQRGEARGRDSEQSHNQDAGIQQLRERREAVAHRLEQLEGEQPDARRELHGELERIEQQLQRLTSGGRQGQHEPGPEHNERREHLLAAIEHLHAAGLHDQANAIERMIDRPADRQNPEREHAEREHAERQGGAVEMRQHMEEMHRHLEDLRREMEHMKRAIEELRNRK